jgi:hypothetical protein
MEAFQPEEMSSLTKLQVLNLMLSGLVFVTEANEFGLFAGDGHNLIGLDGQNFAIKGPIRIAHVVDFFNANVLSEWQARIVELGLVQSFKQVYRELYVVTPAEIASENRSRRFVGHVIDGPKASALLSQRRWRQSSSDVVEVDKLLPLTRGRVELDFPDAGHYLSEQGEVTIDEIRFYGQGGSLATDKVHPIEFSEVMRDVDLLASVAGISSDSIHWSTETASSRINLIKNLLLALDIGNVEFEDHFVFVTGSLAKYRIHLGSGVIHIQPGNYLCIVPDNAKQEDFYLPFDETDKKTTEIISKIFLLREDKKIKDQTILDQISRKELELG